MSQFPQGYGNARVNPIDYESSENTLTVAQFFNTVYAWMCVGLALTAVVAYYVANSPLVQSVNARGAYVLIALVAFAIAWFVQSKAGQLSVAVSTTLFLVYAAVIGALFSGIYLIYPARTLGCALVLTGGTFGAMSVYGFVTKRDLSRIGSIMVMLAFGFIIASFVNLWLASDALSWIITYAILILFIGITAYQTQRLRAIAMQLQDNPQLANRYAIVGSLVLYIAFINLFLSILRILGNRR